jgi:hypothetical protein
MNTEHLRRCALVVELAVSNLSHSAMRWPARSVVPEVGKQFGVDPRVSRSEMGMWVGRGGVGFVGGELEEKEPAVSGGLVSDFS